MARHWLSVDEIVAQLEVNLDTIYEWIIRRGLSAPKARCVLPLLPFDGACVVCNLVLMNLSQCGIETDFGPEQPETFRRDFHPDPAPRNASTAARESADPQPRSRLAGLVRNERQLLANPPFNDSDWFRKDDDPASRDWQFSVPPKGSANFALVQHFIHHLAPQGMGGFVLANSSMCPNQSGDCDARSARREWATDSQGIGSRRHIRLALIQADVARVPVTLPAGSQVALSPGNQNPLIKAVIEHFCPAFAPGGAVLYIGDTENTFVHLEAAGLAALGVTLDFATKIPDVFVHNRAKNWLLLIEAISSAGPVDGKRCKELNDLFAGCEAGLVFVTAFGNHRTMHTFVSYIAWESEVWIVEDPGHMIHFKGERFLGPNPDMMPNN